MSRSLSIRLHCISLLFLVSRVFALEIPLGVIVERVACAKDASQSYAIYLPSNYDNTRTWPVLYCFDPRARGARAVECFREGAERFGFIVVGSNNSRNGPWETNKPVIELLLRDTHARFALNSRRIYTAGLSGGARVAVQLAMSGLAQGTVACSGGFPVPEIPEKLSFVFFGTAGSDDCNYGEMRRIDDELDKRGTAHHVSFFTGGHEWLPAQLGVEAIAWLELQAMRTGLRERDEAMLAATFERRQKSIPAQQPAAWMETKSLAVDFKWVRDTSTVEQRAREMASSAELKAWRKQENRSETEMQSMVTLVEEITAEGSIHGMRGTLETWHKQAHAPDDSQKRRVTRRAIQGAAISVEYNARAQFTEKNFETAATLFEAVLALQPERLGLYLDLARSRCLNKENKAAIAALNKAASLGYKDADRVEKDDALKSLREDPAYREALAAMRALKK